MKKRKLASVTAVLLAACMFLGACSQSGGESSASGGDASSGAAGTESAASESAEPLAINMMVGFDGVEYP